MSCDRLFIDKKRNFQQGWIAHCLLQMLLILSCNMVAKGQERLQSYSSDARIKQLVTYDSAFIESLLKKGDSLQVRSDSNAYDSYLQALNYSIAGKYGRGSARAMGGIGIYYISRGNYPQGIAMLQKGISIAKINRLFSMEAFMNNSLGVAYEHQGLYATGMLHFYKALDLLAQTKTDTIRKAQIHTNLGGLWLRLDEETQALAELKIARELTRENQLSGIYPYILMNTGIAHAPTSKDTALSYFRLSLDLGRRQQDLLLQEKSLINIGCIYLETGQPLKALQYTEEAYRLSKQIETPAARSTAEYALGDVYLQLKQYDIAAPYFLSALKIAEQVNIYEMKEDAHNRLAKLYAATGNYHRAYNHQQIAQTLNDSVQKAEKGKTVELLMQFRTADKNRELADNQLLLARQQDQLKMKNIWLGIILAGLLLSGVLFFSFYRSNLHKKRLHLQQLYALNQRQEIEQLKADSAGEERERTRIAREIHDGIMVQFSAAKMHFSVLKDQHDSLHKSASYVQAMRQLDTAMRELRQIAHNLMPDLLLEEGLGIAAAYFCNVITSLNVLAVSFVQCGDMQRFYPEFEISIYRILQELIQNVIKHAHAHKVLVQLNSYPDMLCMTVEDDGVGFDLNSAAVQNGMGLTSLRNRVKGLGGQCDISSSAGKGTTVYLEFEISSYINKEKNAAYQDNDNR